MPKKLLARFQISPEAALQPGTPLFATHFKVGQYVDVRGKTYVIYNFSNFLNKFLKFLNFSKRKFCILMVQDKNCGIYDCFSKNLYKKNEIFIKTTLRNND